jgi:hypothetical protein
MLHYHRIKVRANFNNKLVAQGGLGNVKEVEEEFYQEFFAKVDKGIFLQKEKL